MGKSCKLVLEEGALEETATWVFNSALQDCKLMISRGAISPITVVTKEKRISSYCRKSGVVQPSTDSS